MDIAACAKLFENHGDEVADCILEKTIRDWVKLTEQNYGWAIKTLGDEIMCV